MSMRVSLSHLTLSSGTRLHYAEQGDRNGPPVLLLHGVTDSWRSFEPLLAALPSRLKVFALSQRGHGDSERPSCGYSMRQFAADAAEFIRAVSGEPMLVLGHSMGSTVAIRLAIDHPALVRGLVLVGAFADYADKAGLREYVQCEIAHLQDPIAEGFAREFQLSTLAQPVPVEFLDVVVSESLKLPAALWRAVFASVFDDNFGAELDRVQAPTRIVWGDRDAYAPLGDQQRLARGIHGAELEVHAGVGHATHWERPARVASSLVTFANQLSGLRHAVLAG